MSDEFDDFGDFDDMDDGVKEGGGDREPVTGALKDGVSGFSEAIVDNPETLNNVSSNIAKGFATNIFGEEATDKVSEIGTDFKDEFEDAVDDLRKEARPLGRLIKSMSPSEDSMIGGITHGIGNFLVGDEEEGFKEKSYEELLNEKVTNAISSLSSLNRTKELIDKDLATDKMQFTQMQDQIALSQNNVIANTNVDKFLRSNTLEYYKKHLELQYRQVYLTTDIRQLLASGFDRLAKEQDIIAKNTALPDFLKLKSTEALKAAIRQNFTQSVTETFMGKHQWMDNLKFNLTERLKSTKNKVKEQVSGLTELGTMVNEQTGDLDDAGVSVANMAGSEAGDFAVNKSSNVFGRLLAKSPFVRKSIGNVAQLVTSAPEFLEKVENKHSGNVIGKTASYFKDLMKNPLEAHSTELGKNLDEPAIFDNRAKTSLVSVIPSLLGDILKEVKLFRNPKAEKSIYNYKKDVFETESEMNRGFDEEVKLKMYKSGASTAIKSFIDSINKDAPETMKLDKKERRNLTRALYKYIQGNNNLDPYYFDKNGFYELLDRMSATKVKALIKDKIEHNGTYNESAHKSLMGTLNTASNGIFNPLKFINEQRDAGNTQYLKDKGLLKYDKLKEAYVLDMEAYNKYSEGFVNSVGSQGYHDYIHETSRTMEENKKTLENSKPTSILDIVKTAKEDVKNLDKDEVKKKIKTAFNKVVKSAKALDKKVAKMSKEDWKELGIDSKDKAINFIKDNYNKNLSEESRKSIEDKLNYVFESKGYQYTDNKIKTAYNYFKDNDKEAIFGDLHRLRRKGKVRSKKWLGKVKNLKVSDLKEAGFKNFREARDYVSSIYGKHDIETLKKMEKILKDKYDSYDKEHSESLFRRGLNSLKNTIKGNSKRAKSKVDAIRRFIKGYKYKDFKKLGIDNPNDAVRYILKEIDFEPTREEMKQLYADMVKIFKVKKGKETIGEKLKEAKDKVEKKIKDREEEKSTVDRVKDIFSNVGDAIKSTFDDSKTATKKTEEEKVEPKEETNPFGDEEDNKEATEEKEDNNKDENSKKEETSKKEDKKTSEKEKKKKSKKEDKKEKKEQEEKNESFIEKLFNRFKKDKSEDKKDTKKDSLIDRLLKKFDREEKAEKKKKRRSFYDSDGDGKRNGSWRELLSNTFSRKKDKDVNPKVKPDKKKKKSGGWLSKLFWAVSLGFAGVKKIFGAMKDGMSGVGSVLGGIAAVVGGIAAGLGFGPLRLAWGATKLIGKGAWKFTKMMGKTIGRSAVGVKDVFTKGPGFLGSLVGLVKGKGLRSAGAKTALKFLGKFIKFIPVFGPLLSLGIDFGLDYLFDDSKAEEPKYKLDKDGNVVKIDGDEKKPEVSKALKPYEEKAIKEDLEYKEALKNFQHSKAGSAERQKYQKIMMEHASKKHQTKNEFVTASKSLELTGKVQTSNDKPIAPVTDPSSFAGKKLTGLAKTVGTIIRIVESKQNYASAHVGAGEHFVSFGAYQYIEKFSILKNVLKLIAKKNPSYINELNGVINNFGKEYFRGSRAVLLAFLKKIGFTKESIEAQDEYFYKNYFIPAQKKAAQKNLTDNFVVAHIVDHMLNAGPVGRDNVIKMTKSNTMESVVAARLEDYKHKNSSKQNYNGWKNRVNRVSKMLVDMKVNGTKYDKIDQKTYSQFLDKDKNGNDINNSQETTNESGGGNPFKTAFKLALSGLLSFFGIKSDKPDSMIGSEPTGVEPNKGTNIDGNALKKNDASIKNPLISDWKTKKRYDSLNDTAKKFFSQFSHFVAGYNIKLMIPALGGNRTLKNQQKLYDIGRKTEKNRKPVTWTLKSKHRGGRAIDIISAGGWKDKETNAKIAKLMRAFANINPEFEAHFLAITKDPNHVDFPKSNPIGEIDVEAEISGEKDPKKLQKEVEASYDVNKNNGAKSTVASTGNSSSTIIPGLNTNALLSPPKDDRLKSVMDKGKAVMPKKEETIPVKDFKGIATPIIKPITNLGKEGKNLVDNIIKKGNNIVPEVTHKTNPHVLHTQQIEQVVTQIQKHQVTSQPYDKFAEHNNKTLIDIYKVLLEIDHTSKNMYSVMSNKEPEKMPKATYNKNVKPFKEPAIGIDLF